MTSPVILTEGVARLRHDIEQHLPDGAAQAEHDANTFFATDLPALSARHKPDAPLIAATPGVRGLGARPSITAIELGRHSAHPVVT
jgi:hypothetical protein